MGPSIPETLMPEPDSVEDEILTAVKPLTEIVLTFKPSLRGET
jgi:hypothetical protein